MTVQNKAAATVATVVAAAVLMGTTFGGQEPTPSSALERAAFSAAEGRVAQPDRFEPETFRFAGEAPPPGADFDLVDIDGPNESGVVRMTFAVLSDQEPREIWTTVRGRVHGPALVATRPMNRGQAIVADDIAQAEVDLTRLRDEPLRDPSRLIGMTPVRTLGTGRVITADLLQAMPVVRRNQAVRLEFVRPGFSVSATGTALADGAPGETITAVNGSTGARVLCEVQGDGTLHVIRGLGGGRR